MPMSNKCLKMVEIGSEHQTLAFTCSSGFSPVSLSPPWPLLVSLSMSFVSRSRKMMMMPMMKVVVIKQNIRSLSSDIFFRSP